MSEAIPSCPVCGGTDTPIPDGRHRFCVPCGFYALDANWNRLSRAATLLRAVEGLEETLRQSLKHEISIEAMEREYKQADGPMSATLTYFGMERRTAEQPTLPAALIALAQKLETRDAE